MIRVLVVDDSALARKLIRDALEEAGDIEVAGCASDGFSACQQVTALRPDVLTLDIGMPGMDGLTFLRKVKGQNRVPAVVVSAMTGVGCKTALEALRAGAVEVIGKPVDRPGFIDFRALLPAKVRAAFACRQAFQKPAPDVQMGASAVKLRVPALVAIGSSTGGTEAIEKILRRMPADCPGIVIAQHIPARFSAMFAERLAQVCEIQVKEAANGDKIRSGLALIAPGDWHMTVQKRPGGFETMINQGPRVSFQRPSVDLLLQSVAIAAGGETVGVILTGMGNDGTAGLLAMKRAGAATIAQDEATCAVFGMPKEAIRAGAVDHVLPLHQIAATLGRMHAPRTVGAFT
jgi:two-component system chemotaxis response regulator CheB